MPTDAKQCLTEREYLASMRALSGAERVRIAFELSEMSRRVMKDGLRHRHPHLNEQDLQSVYLKLLDRCHNQNY